MAHDEETRLSKKIIEADKTTYDNLLAITGFVPVKKEFEIANGTKLSDTMTANRTKENQLVSALKTSKDNSKTSEWAFHNWILGAKGQIAAQFGDDSNEYQSLGLKKKSERKRPTRKPKK